MSQYPYKKQKQKANNEYSKMEATKEEKTLLIEVGLEEVGAGDQKRLVNSLVRLVTQDKNFKEGDKTKLREISTPRRIGLLWENVIFESKSEIKISKGPFFKQVDSAKEEIIAKPMRGFLSKNASLDEQGIKSYFIGDTVTEEGVRWLNELVQLDEKTNLAEEADFQSKQKGFFLQKKGEKLFLAHFHRTSQDDVGDVIGNALNQWFTGNQTNAMLWGENKGPFIRPLRHLTLMWGKETIPYNKWNVIAENRSFSHRFFHPASQLPPDTKADTAKSMSEDLKSLTDLANESSKILGGIKIELDDPSEYFERLEKHGVIANYEQRKKKIKDGFRSCFIEKYSQEAWEKNKQKININYDELAMCCENPVLVEIDFDIDDTLPIFFFYEILNGYRSIIASSVEGLEPAIFLLAVSDMPSIVGEDTKNNQMLSVRKGFAQVVRARVEDGVFFAKKDLDFDVGDLLENLRNENGELSKKFFYGDEITVQSKIGLMKVMATVFFDADAIGYMDILINFYHIGLFTDSVQEFPSLQRKWSAYMSAKLITDSGEEMEKIISNKSMQNKSSYYGLNEKIKESFEGNDAVSSFLMAAFDKDNWIGFLDDLSQLFLLKLETDIRSTSSQDEYGLRNKCKKVIQFLVENQIGLNVKDLIYHVYQDKHCGDFPYFYPYIDLVDKSMKMGDNNYVYTKVTVERPIVELLELFKGFRGYAKPLIRDGVISDFIPKRNYFLRNHSSGNSSRSRDEENWDEDNPHFFYNHLDSPYIASELEKQWNSYIQTHEKRAYLNSLQRCRKIVKKMEKGHEKNWQSREKFYERKLTKDNADEMAKQLFEDTIEGAPIETKQKAKEVLNENKANFLNENNIEEEERKLILLHLEVSDDIAEEKKKFEGCMVKNGEPLFAYRNVDGEIQILYPYGQLDASARKHPQHYKSRLEIGWAETCRMVMKQRRIEKRANGPEKDDSPTIATADSDSKGSAKNINFFEINHRYLDALEKFFEKVYVEDERPIVRERRLNLLAGIEKNMGIGFEIRQMKSEIDKGEGT